MFIFPLLADLDMKNSTATWFFLGVGIFGSVFSIILQFYYLLYFCLGLLVITFLIAKLAKHRGNTHSIITGIIFSYPLFLFISLEYFCLGIIVYYSHLVADGFIFK
jgi:membrane-bound metal-dependent hydrolase YbcI (DUF457 family)